MGSRVVRRTVSEEPAQRFLPVTETNQVNVPFKYTSFVQAVASVNTVATLWVPAAGKRFRLQGYTMSVSSAAFGTFRAAGQTSANFQFNTKRMTPAVEGDTVSGISYACPTTGVALCIDSSLAGATFTGTVWGSEED